MENLSDFNQDNDLKKGTQAGEQAKPDGERPKTVTPDNDNGMPGKPEDKEEETSNKDQGPAGENL